MTARVAVPNGGPVRCPTGARGAGRPRPGRDQTYTEANRDLDETPPAWAALAVARRRALRELRRTAEAFGADGVVGVTFQTHDGYVVGHGVTVRRRRVPAAAPSDEAFTTHLSHEAADLVVEAGMTPRRVVVNACRAVLHDPQAGRPDRSGAVPGEPGGLDRLVAAAREAVTDVWRGAGRRRGPSTVLVGPVEVAAELVPCSQMPGRYDEQVVVLGTATVFAGAADRSRAADLVARLERIVVPVGAGGGSW